MTSRQSDTILLKELGSSLCRLISMLHSNGRLIKSGAMSPEKGTV